MRAKNVYFSIVGVIVSGFSLAGGCFGVNGDEVNAVATYTASDGSYRLDYVTPPWRVDKEEDSVLRLVVDAKVFGFSLGEELPPTHLFIATKVNLKDTLTELLDADVLKSVAEANGIDTQNLPDLPDHLPDLPENLPDFLTIPPDLILPDGDDGSGADDDDSSAFPDYLVGVDLGSPADVATAELRFLLETEGNRLERGLTYFTTKNGQRALVYELTVDPGVFVRNFYLPTKTEALRLSFISLYDLENADIDRMAESAVTDALEVSPLPAGGNP
jgi:hypothetical protein